ncbi:hypothetical protein KEM54_004842 [Ascosphaera aggregata]|nr:hypothetical protein KEM54_004842 [Ascosphaera aggregata]
MTVSTLNALNDDVACPAVKFRLANIQFWSFEPFVRADCVPNDAGAHGAAVYETRPVHILRAEGTPGESDGPAQLAQIPGTWHKFGRKGTTNGNGYAECNECTDSSYGEQSANGNIPCEQ